MIANEISRSKEILSEISQGSALGSLRFLIYINDLKICMPFWETYHFTTDTNIKQSNKSLEVLAKDLSNLLYWLRVNKVWLIVKTQNL